MPPAALAKIGRSGCRPHPTVVLVGRAWRSRLNLKFGRHHSPL